MSLFYRSPRAKRSGTTSDSPVDRAVHVPEGFFIQRPIRRSRMRDSSYTTGTYTSRPVYRSGLARQQVFRVI
jgi:hypothetical protein